ncbi:MAG: CHASE2 domain-containing protein [Candidatus Binatia bacterium]
MRVSLKSWFSINPVSLTLVTILAVVFLFFSRIPILDVIELKTYDLRFLWRGQLQPSPAIVLALIDEKSLDTEGRWPWPRSKLATLVDILSRDGAKVIGFDIGFPEPDENSQLGLLQQLRREVESLAIENPQLTDFIDERTRVADNDRTFANAIKNASATVVLGYFFYESEADLGYQVDQHEIDQRLKRISSSKYPLVTYKAQGMEVVSSAVRAYVPESNLTMLAEAAASSGHMSVRPDQDGVVRWMPLMILGGEDLFPPLSLLCAWHYLDKPQLTVKIGTYGAEGVEMGDRFIPTDETGRLLINYLGPAKTFPHVSISDILGGRIAKGTFADKIVLVGSTAMGAHDLRNTPFSALNPLFSGVEIHATVVDNILTQRFLVNPSWSTAYDLVAIVLLGGLIALALPRIGAFKGLLLAAILFTLHILVARRLFEGAGIWLNIVYPLLALSANYVVLSVYGYVSQERERRRIKETFSHYVAPVVIEEMLKEPTRLKLGGEEKFLTVMFSDLQGFTSVSEQYAPREMVEILSEYYTRMTERVFLYQGTLVEYVGDELMALFGAPIEQPDHAERACAAALAMREQRNMLNMEALQRGRLPLIARTGINSGLMLVGNLGSQYRFNYGVIGDQVNLASRLEGLNKTYGTHLLISEQTAQLVEQTFLLREVDLVRVVGRAQAVRIYELLAARNTSLARAHEEALSAYAAGLEAYRQRYWDEARKLFAAALAVWKEDGPARVMLARCQNYQRTPPSEEWGGVFEALQK